MANVHGACEMKSCASSGKIKALIRCYQVDAFSINGVIPKVLAKKLIHCNTNKNVVETIRLKFDNNN